MRLTVRTLFSVDATFVVGRRLGRDRRNESARKTMGRGLSSLPHRPPPGGKSDKALVIHLWITKSPNNTCPTYVSTFQENYHALNILKNIFINPFHTRIGARISVISLIAFPQTPCIVFKLYKKVKSFLGQAEFNMGRYGGDECSNNDSIVVKSKRQFIESLFNKTKSVYF